MKKVLFIIVIVVLVGVLLFSGYQVYRNLHSYQVVEEYYDTAAQYIVSQAPTAAPEPVNSPTEEPETSVPEMSVAELETADEPVETAPIAIDFDALLADCPDTVGWLYAPDESINLPVVQGDDNRYYLKRLPDGTYSSGGSLFLDYLNTPDFTDDTSFIYGHNMRNGTMLQPLLEYKKQDHYNSNAIMYLLTPEQNFKIEIFAGILTDLESDVYTFSFGSPEEKQAFIDDLVSRSTFTPYYVPDADSALLCLSTCAYDFENARYVVFGKLTEIG